MVSYGLGWYHPAERRGANESFISKRAWVLFLTTIYFLSSLPSSLCFFGFRNDRAVNKEVTCIIITRHVLSLAERVGDKSHAYISETYRGKIKLYSNSYVWTRLYLEMSIYLWHIIIFISVRYGVILITEPGCS